MFFQLGDKFSLSQVLTKETTGIQVNVWCFSIPLQTMETRPVVPDRKLLARLVLIREEARDMMGGGILDERNNRGLYTLPQSEVC